MATLRYGDVVESSIPEEVTPDLDELIKERRASTGDTQSPPDVSNEQTETETQ